VAPFRWMNRRERDRSLGHRRLAQRLVGDGLIMQKSVVESAGQRTHVIRSIANPCNRSVVKSSRALRLIPARDPLGYLSRLGGRCREVALRASAFGAGVDLEPMWAPKRRNNHRQAHFIATGRTVRAADLFCDPRCHDSLRSEPFPRKRAAWNGNALCWDNVAWPGRKNEDGGAARNK
jgi:hypothetical protein